MDSEAQCNTLSESNLKTSQSSGSSSTSSDEPCDQEKPSISGEGLNSQKTYKCNECGATFSRLTHLKDHMNRHIGKRFYKCQEEKCSKGYFAWKHLRKHLISTHKLDNVRKSSYVKKERGHKCTFEGCTAIFDRRWKLASHMCSHTGEKLFACSEYGCNKAYTSVGHLRRHVANIHMGKPKVVSEYSCTEVGCDKVYRSVESVRRHYTIHHNKDRPTKPPYTCGSCNEVFSIPGHLESHKCGAYAPYKCEECKITFTNLKLWKKHRKIHVTFKCEVPDCNKEFPQNSLLKEHRKQDHKGSFPCQSCDKIFNSKSNLKTHQQTHLMHDDRKLFPCPYSGCSRFYTRKFNLDQHIRSGHKDIKFQCTVPGCEKRLVTKQKLQEHMKMHDPLREPLPRKQMARRQRKDAGKPKRSMAVKLSGVAVSYAEEQNILRSGVNKQMSNSYTSETGDGGSESEGSNGLSDTDEWSELSEPSDEMSDLSEGSDEWNESNKGLIDCVPEILQIKCREMIERMARALGSVPQSGSNSSEQLECSQFEVAKEKESVNHSSTVVRRENE